MLVQSRRLQRSITLSVTTLVPPYDRQISDSLTAVEPLYTSPRTGEKVFQIYMTSETSILHRNEIDKEETLTSINVLVINTSPNPTGSVKWN
jgi:hypothetical protein